MRAVIYVFILFPMSLLCGQNQAAGVIHLINPSFEDQPKMSSAPSGWTDCGFQGETGPDIHPGNFWEVTTKPFDGNTYLGMVARQSDTWERISQPLKAFLRKGQCYNFSIYLCRSKTYVSGVSFVDANMQRKKEEYLNFTDPIILRVWGGNMICGRTEILAESIPINHSDWKEYSFKFEPRHDLNHIMLEAFYKTPVLVQYNGHILLDFASDIIPIECKD